MPFKLLLTRRSPILIILVIIISVFSQNISYSFFGIFNEHDAPWESYGDGLSNQSKEQELFLDTDFGEAQTFHKTFKKLDNALYKISFEIKAQNIQKDIYDYSFWHFYDLGKGTTSPFTNLVGSFDWRKVEYTIIANNKPITFWFRLKSPGKAWIKNFQLTKVNRPLDKVIFGAITPLTNNDQISPPQTEDQTIENVVLNFENKKSVSSIKTKKITNTNSVGEFSPYEYINLDPTLLTKLAIKKFNYIEMDVYNPNKTNTPFYFSLSDNQSTNYWTQLNFKNTLAPGINHLVFNLHDYVGERGSHRIYRKLNLNSLKKIFFHVDGERQNKFTNIDFWIDNLKLSKHTPPIPPKNIWAIDFTSHKANHLQNFINVTSQNIYATENGMGFITPQYWRIEDSVFANELYRYSIGLLKGKFRIDLPNGQYRLALCVNNLGYWDVPFWNTRSIKINGRNIVNESRNNASDYINDTLKFKDIDYNPNLSLYKNYYANFFKTIESNIKIQEGYIEFEFEGDPTAINLNSLFIWNINNEKNFNQYKNKLDAFLENEISTFTRNVDLSINQLNNKDKLSVDIIAPTLDISPKTVYRTNTDNEVLLTTGINESAALILQIYSPKSDATIQFEVSNLVNEENKSIIPGKQIKIRKIIPQITSLDLNHETYRYNGSYLKNIDLDKETVSSNTANHFWIDYSHFGQFKKGLYKGYIQINANNEKIKIPICLNIADYTLEHANFPVGFFGLTPMPTQYFKSNDIDQMYLKYQNSAISGLKTAGFTTFTGLPEVKISFTKENKIVWDTTRLDAVINQIKKHDFANEIIFSYGGNFPKTLFDYSQKPDKLSEEQYDQILSIEFKKLLAQKKWPQIIYMMSDEADGYSDRLAEDIQTAQKLKKLYPYLKIGGFTNLKNSKNQDLIKLLDISLFNEVKPKDVDFLNKNNKKWGLYNQSPKGLDDPRSSFGFGLYVAFKAGLNAYLEWNTANFNNYPYFDLDGRESDVVIFYPGPNGQVYNSLRFEMAKLGINQFQKLLVLEKILLNQSISNTTKGIRANNWLHKLKETYKIQDKSGANKLNSLEFDKISRELDSTLSDLL